MGWFTLSREPLLLEQCRQREDRHVPGWCGHNRCTEQVSLEAPELFGVYKSMT